MKFSGPCLEGGHKLFLMIKKKKKSPGRAFKQGTSAKWPYHIGAGEMNGKIISEPSVKDSHNTSMTCHENSLHEENSSTIYSALEKCGKAFPIPK